MNEEIKIGVLMPEKDRDIVVKNALPEAINAVVATVGISEKEKNYTSVHFITVEEFLKKSEDEYDMVVELIEDEQSCEYSKKFLDTTYNNEIIQVVDGNGNIGEMSFGRFKQMLVHSTQFVANLNLLKDWAMKLNECYYMTLNQFDPMLAETVDNMQFENPYTQPCYIFEEAEYESRGIYQYTVDKYINQLENLFKLPPHLQRSLLGTAYKYDKDKLESIRKMLKVVTFQFEMDDEEPDDAAEMAVIYDKVIDRIIRYYI